MDVAELRTLVEISLLDFIIQNNYSGCFTVSERCGPLQKAGTYPGVLVLSFIFAFIKYSIQLKG